MNSAVISPTKGMTNKSWGKLNTPTCYSQVGLTLPTNYYTRIRTKY